MVGWVLDRELTNSGLVIAGVGFFLTRFTVTLSVRAAPVEFLFAGLLPLVLGLLLAAFGVALAVGSVRPRFVRTTAAWTLIGTGGMGVLVVATLLGTSGADPASIGSGPVLSNFLIGGAFGGAMVGVYAGRTRESREQLRLQANRLATLNRLLRDRVLNAVSVIEGHAQLLQAGDGESGSESVETIVAQAESIEGSIDEIATLTETASDTGDLDGVDLAAAVDGAAAAVAADHPDVAFAVTVPDGISVRANDHLTRVFVHLLDNAATYTDAEDPRVTVDCETTAQNALVRVEDDGPGLPDPERETLESGAITPYDDPRTGFGLNVVRLLVERYGGTIRTTVDEGTTIEVELPLERGESPLTGTNLAGAGSYGVSERGLFRATVAALVAGGAMGVLSQALSGTVPVIGALYGAHSELVGWITHEFHSVVFGFVFAALSTASPWARDLRGRVALALGFSVVLWLVAAGVVMPLWLRLIGIPAPVPTLTASSLLTHAVWGLVLGAVYHGLQSRRV